MKTGSYVVCPLRQTDRPNNLTTFETPSAVLDFDCTRPAGD